MPKYADPAREARFAQAIEAINRGQTIQGAAKEYGLPYTTLHGRLRGTKTPRYEIPAGKVHAAEDGLREFSSEEGEIPVFIRDYSDQELHRPYPLGDLHIGAPEFQEDALDEWFQYLLDTPNTSLLNTGDNTNCALTTSVSDTYKEKLTVQEARQKQTEKFRPLAEANKIDAIIDGNHEMRVYRSTGDSPNSAVADALNLNYSMAACVVRYLVGDQSYDVFLRHGTGGGGTMGAAVNRLQKQEQIIDADIYVSGHTHTQVAFPKNRFVPDGRGGFCRRKTS